EDMCDNCKNPKEKIEGQDFIKLLLKGVEGARGRFKPKEMARIMMGEEEREEIHDFFKETEEFSFDEARVEFDENEFSDNEIRLLRIDFISKVAN
ncbi:hypothetical protein N9S08_01210, partial [Flavobacteriales bacterium]|nr:hypothetical protein [Flavobacteriales bacterium]